MNKKIVWLILIISIFVCMEINLYGQADSHTQKADIKGHWAEDTLTKWTDIGILHGYSDGTIKPDSTISKVEFISLVNRIFGYYEKGKTNYSDISGSDWYAEQTTIAIANGYMDWYTQDQLNAADKISRQEVCAVLYSIMQLETTEKIKLIRNYSDYNTIPDWSKGYVAAVVEKGYMSGYPDQTLRVDKGITRAEAVVMLNQIMGELINISGTYGPSNQIRTIKGNVTINVKDVTIQNEVIEGDLIIGAGVGEGHVELNNLIVKGRTIINGGGKNSVIIHNSEMNEIIVFKINGEIRVVSSNSTIGKVLQKSGGKLEGEFGESTVEVLAQGKTVELEGDFNKLILNTKVNLEITEETKVKNIKIQDGAEGTQIDTKKGTEVGKIIFDVPANVEGKGEIKKVVVNSNDVEIEQRVGEKEVAKGVDGSHIHEKSKSSSRSSSSPGSSSDTTAPSGYSVTIDQVEIDSSNENALSFTFSGAEVGATYYYSIDDEDGTTPEVTSSAAITKASQRVTGIDVSTLADGTLTLTVYLEDGAGNQGADEEDTVEKNTAIIDTTAPSGYSVTIDQVEIDSSNENALSFTFSGAEVGATYYYSIDDEDGTTPEVTSSAAITKANQSVTGIDVSTLADGTLTLTVYLEDGAGNRGADEEDMVEKNTAIIDTTAPSGYSVTIDQVEIDSSNENALSFTFSGAEVGATYHYSIDDEDGTTPEVTGSDDVTGTDQRVTGIDVSTLADGTLTLTVYLVDGAGNQGADEEDMVEKNTAIIDTTAPSGYSVTIDQVEIDSSNENALSFTFSGAEMGATYHYSIDDEDGTTPEVTGSDDVTGTDQSVTGIDVSTLADGTLTLTVYLVDGAGNRGADEEDTVEKNTAIIDTTAPSGYSVTIDQVEIDSSNENALSFTFNGAEVGATYHYSIDDEDGSTPAVTSSAAITRADQKVTGIDVSTLADGTLTLTVYLVDGAGNQGADEEDTVEKDTTAPSGYSVNIVQGSLNSSNETDLSFTFSGAEEEATYYYSIDDEDGSTPAVTSSAAITRADQKVTGIDVSSLADGTLTLTVYLVDGAGNRGADEEETVEKDTTAPSGYSVTIDQVKIDSSNETDFSFTFSGAEVGATYHYSIDDEDGTTPAITGSDDVTGIDQSVTGIDVSTLADGTLTLTVYLVDGAGNQGADEADTVEKDTTAPSGYSVTIDQVEINSSNENALSFTFSGAEVGATYHYSIDDEDGTTPAVTGSDDVTGTDQSVTGIDVSTLADGTLTLTVYLVDGAGNQGADDEDTVNKQQSSPYPDLVVSGYTFDPYTDEGNGIYVFDGMINGKPSYKFINSEGHIYIIKWRFEDEYYNVWEWELWRDGSEVIYYHLADTVKPPNNGWKWYANDLEDEDFRVTE